MARSPTDAGMEWIDACCSLGHVSLRLLLLLHHNLNDTITPASQCWWSSIVIDWIDSVRHQFDTLAPRVDCGLTDN